MIEILCIAAEITAVLLILSIAIPAAATKHASKVGTPENSNVDSKLLHDCEDSLLALRSLLYLQASQSVASVSPELAFSESYSAAIHRLRDHLDTIEPLQVSSTIDSITKLPNRRELGNLLEASTQWSPFVTVPTWIGLLQIDNLDQLDDEHGPMATEMILREVANFLRDRIGGLGPLVRFNLCGFATVLHGWSQVTAIEFLESVRSDIQHLTVTVGESPIATTASASVATLDLTESLDAHWERLEDGIVEAIAKGADRGRWFDAADSTWRPMGAENDEESADEPTENTSLDDANSDETSDKVRIASTASNPVQSTEPTNTADASEIATTSSDSTIDALGADDIATLFKAAQSNQRAKSSAPTEPNPRPSTVENEPKSEESSGATDIQDDIAALFKAARAFKGPSMPTGAEADPPKPVTKPKVDDSVEEAPAATNDDIESLFAAFKKPGQ